MRTEAPAHAVETKESAEGCFLRFFASIKADGSSVVTSPSPFGLKSIPLRGTDAAIENNHLFWWLCGRLRDPCLALTLLDTRFPLEDAKGSGSFRIEISA